MSSRKALPKQVGLRSPTAGLARSAPSLGGRPVASVSAQLASPRFHMQSGCLGLGAACTGQRGREVCASFAGRSALRLHCPGLLPCGPMPLPSRCRFGRRRHAARHATNYTQRLQVGARIVHRFPLARVWRDAWRFCVLGQGKCRVSPRTMSTESRLMTHVKLSKCSARIRQRSSPGGPRTPRHAASCCD